MFTIPVRRRRRRRVEINHPGIPGADNRWFPSQGQARKAALVTARQLGLGYGLAHDPRPRIGLPHYHIVDPRGRRVSGHYFYGRHLPRRMSRIRASGEADQFFGSPGRFFTRPRIEDRTHLAARGQRKGHRDRQTVDALVLHQMACCRQRKEGGYDRIGSHYAILADGRILQFHPVEVLVHASNGFNKRSVAVEFAGNFPNTRGKCWKGKKYGCHQLTPAQVESGRYLIDHLRNTINLKYIFAHRQSSASRSNDPGPDIWYHVGQWALDKYGLSDGGPGYRIAYSASTKARIKGLGDGQPIPAEWRTWGRRP